MVEGHSWRTFAPLPRGSIVAASLLESCCKYLWLQCNLSAQGWMLSAMCRDHEKKSEYWDLLYPLFVNMHFLFAIGFFFFFTFSFIDLPSQKSLIPSVSTQEHYQPQKQMLTFLLHYLGRMETVPKENLKIQSHVLILKRAKWVWKLYRYFFRSFVCFCWKCGMGGTRHWASKQQNLSFRCHCSLKAWRMQQMCALYFRCTIPQYGLQKDK